MAELIKKSLKINKSNWKLVKFGDIVFEPKENVKDFSREGIQHVVGLEHIDPESIHLRRSNGTDESTTFTKKFEIKDILFGRRRAYLKKAAQAEFNGVCSGDITVLRANDRIIPELLPWIVQNEKYFDYAIKHSAGGLSPRVKFKDLANYEFLLPPEEQQFQLAELLWAADQIEESTKSLLEKASKMTESYVHQQQTHFAGEYNSVKLGDIVNISTGKLDSNAAVEGGKYPFFTCSPDTLRINEYAFDTEAILLAGNNAAGVYPIKYYEGKFNAYQRTYVITIKKPKLIGYVYLLETLRYRLDVLQRLSVGSSTKFLTMTILKNLKIPIPPNTVQEEFNNTLDTISVTKNSIIGNLKTSKNLKNNLINQIF